MSGFLVAAAACMLLLIILIIALAPAYCLGMIMSELARMSYDEDITGTCYSVRKEEEDKINCKKCRWMEDNKCTMHTYNYVAETNCVFYCEKGGRRR